MPLSEEWLDLDYLRKQKESSITYLVWPLLKWWREDFKLLLPRESLPTQFITLEFSSDKDTSLLVNHLSTFPATWLESALNNTFNSLQLQYSRLVKWEEQRRRSPRSQQPVEMMTVMTNECTAKEA